MHPVPHPTADTMGTTIITVITTETTATITTEIFTVIKMTDITPTEAIITMADFTEREDYRPDKRKKYMEVKAQNTMPPDKPKSATTITTIDIITKTTKIINTIKIKEDIKNI